MTRYNGHKQDLVGTPGQWQILTKEHEKCWICDKWIYSLVFFNPTRQCMNLLNNHHDLKHYIIKRIDQLNGTERNESTSFGLHQNQDFLYQKLYDMNSDASSSVSYNNTYKQEFTYSDNQEEVTIYASFTNWKPRKMTPFLVFIEKIDSSRVDFMHELRKRRRYLESHIKNVDQLTEEEYDDYLEIVKNYRQSLVENW